MKKSRPHLPNTTFNRNGITKFQCTVRNVYKMTTHISQRSGSEISPATPGCRKICRIKISLRSSPQPQIPIQFFWYFKFAGGRSYALWPHRPVGPHMHGVYVTNQPTLYPRFYPASVISAASLVAHL